MKRRDLLTGLLSAIGLGSLVRASEPSGETIIVEVCRHDDGLRILKGRFSLKALSLLQESGFNNYSGRAHLNGWNPDFTAIYWPKKYSIRHSGVCYVFNANCTNVRFTKEPNCLTTYYDKSCTERADRAIEKLLQNGFTEVFPDSAATYRV